MALTEKGIAKLAPGRYRDKDTRGLYLQVSPTRTRAWLLRFELNKRERFMGLGPYPDFSLKEARQRAREARQKLADGIDPIEARDAERRAKEKEARKQAGIPTFREAAKRWHQVHSPKWRNVKATKQTLATLEAYAFPRLGNLRVDEIATEDVRAALEPIWHRIPETASRTRGRIEGVLSWSIANKYREGPNPARWSDNLEHLLPAQVSNGANHHPALPYQQLPEFMVALKERDGVAARALEFTILTAARTGETIGARWDEIDLKQRVWSVPSGRIKGGREHRVPLADRAVQLLKELGPESGNKFVFLGSAEGRGLSNMSMAAVLKRIGRDDVTVHGFRSTFRDWAAERTGFANHIVEMALAHVIGNKVEAAYRRGDLFEKRKRLMSDWAKYCASKPVAAGANNVVSLRGE